MATLVGLFMRSYSSLPLQVDWEAEAYPAYGDYAVLPVLVVCFPAMRFLLDRFVFEVLATRLIFGKGYELLTLSATYSEPWFTNTRYFWVGPGDLLWPDLKIKLKLKVVHMYVTGFYIYSIFALLFWETRRKDFGVMMSHHVSTVFLIVMSYICRCFRPGSITLAIHDASDILLEAGKMAKYCGCERLAVIAFLLFVASWILLRLIIFPFWIIRSTSYEVVLILDEERKQIYRYYTINILLSSLLVLHMYWSVLIYRMLVKQIQSRGRVGDDVRSDSEGENDHED